MDILEGFSWLVQQKLSSNDLLPYTWPSRSKMGMELKYLAFWRWLYTPISSDKLDPRVKDHDLGHPTTKHTMYAKLFLIPQLPSLFSFWNQGAKGHGFDKSLFFWDMLRIALLLYTVYRIPIPFPATNCCIVLPWTLQGDCSPSSTK